MRLIQNITLLQLLLKYTFTVRYIISSYEGKFAQFIQTKHLPCIVFFAVLLQKQVKLQPRVQSRLHNYSFHQK